MAEVAHIQEESGSKKRKLGGRNSKSKKKKMKVFRGTGNKVKIDQKMQKVFRKRARDYNSDDDEDNDDGDEHEELETEHSNEKESDDDGEEQVVKRRDDAGDDEEAGEILPGITKFSEGCKAFEMAFKAITKKNVSENVLGPVLSAHKKLVAQMLAEDEVEKKVKGDKKKVKHVVAEKGHVMPANFLDTKEKFLIGVATKGVVKLFNAVNKAQSTQKGLNPLRSKDAKVIKKRRKEAFFSELKKTQSGESSNKVDGEGPGWAPLRDNYMLTNSKLKNWDKMKKDDDSDASGDDFGVSGDSSSDEN
jgi:hypothetical protein